MVPCVLASLKWTLQAYLLGRPIEGQHRLHLRHVPGPDGVLEQGRGFRGEGGGLVLQGADAAEGLFGFCFVV